MLDVIVTADCLESRSIPNSLIHVNKQPDYHRVGRAPVKRPHVVLQKHIHHSLSLAKNKQKNLSRLFSYRQTDSEFCLFAIQFVLGHNSRIVFCLGKRDKKTDHHSSINKNCLVSLKDKCLSDKCCSFPSNDAQKFAI